MENTIWSPASVIFDKKDEIDAYANITAPSQTAINSIIQFLVKRFTYENPKKKSYGNKKTNFVRDCNERAFDKKTQTLQIGLIPKAVKYLKESKINVKIGVSPSIRSIYTKAGGDITDVDVRKYADTLNIYNTKKKKKLIPYEHQIQITKEIINGRRISTLACTSCGKSLSIYIAARYLLEVEKHKILIITPSKNLVVQLFDNFVDDYGWKEAKDYCTLIYGESKDKLTISQKQKLKDLNLGEETMLKDITISTWQSLQRQPDKFFGCFHAVIVDEAHSTRGEVLREILDKCVNATNFKVGMSGTLPDDGLDSAWIEGAIGRKEIIIKLWELIEMGILPPMKVSAIKIPYKQSIRAHVCREKYQDEYFLLTNNGSRKAVMDLLLGKQITTEHNTLILYKNKTTLDEMVEYLEAKHPEYTYHVIKGEISTKDRMDIFSTLEESLGNIIVATYGTMKQGVNIPLLHNLVLAEFSKSMYEIVQGMGRVARAHENKQWSHVFDIYDDCTYMTKPRTNGYPPTLVENYSTKHFNTRYGYYIDENITVTEYSLEGIYEADINTDALAEKKQKALEEAAKSKTKNKSTTRKKLGNKSQFLS